MCNLPFYVTAWSGLYYNLAETRSLTNLTPYANIAVSDIIS